MNTQVIAVIQAAVICCGGVGGYFILTQDNGEVADCTVTIEVNGPGSVDSSQVAVKKGTDFSSDGNKLTIGKKTVTATPDAGCVFKGWNPDKGKVNGDMKIAVSFEKAATCTVTITAGTGGSVSKSSVQVDKDTPFSASANVLTVGTEKITATPNEGYTFSNWNPASGNVDKDITVIANFQKSASTITFYFTDNFDNDDFECKDMYHTDCKAIIPGVWIDADGQTATDALKNACDKFGIELKIQGGAITKISDVEDTNIYFWVWENDQWNSRNSEGEYITLADLDAGSYQYIALVHGSADEYGNAPDVNATPDNITWKYGVSGAPGSGKEVKFFISNTFDYCVFTPTRTDELYIPSEPKTFLVRGVWVSGWANYGELVMVALENALDRIGFEYNIGGSFINSINECTGGNFLQAEWDKETDNWFQDTWTHFFGVDLVDDIDYAAAVYGAWGGGYTDPPWPKQGMHDCNWAY